MAGVITTTITWSSSAAVTDDKLNQIVTGSSFTDQAITGTTLAVTGGQLKVGTITSNEMGAASVTNTALAASSVTTSKIADGNVTEAKLANNCVSSAKISDSAVYIEHIAATAKASQPAMQNESSNPLVTPNVVKYSPGVAKAYGCVGISSSSRPISGPYNVSSTGTRNSSTSTTITFEDAMANTNYTVILTLYTDGTATTINADVSAKTTDDFTIKHPTEGAPYERVGFVVFGTLATA